ncbi:MAG: YjeF-related protein [Proteobacteria bacterium]|nr:YjeF-related protein [Pseudomonadota bacterium]
MTASDKSPLPNSLYRASQVRAMDRYAIEHLGIPGSELMLRAASAAFEILRERWPAARTVSVLCGSGNNGGDGYVLARLARQAGLDVRAYPAADPTGLHGDALTAFHAYRDAEGPVLDFIPEGFEGAAVLVDGLLGTGLDRPVSGLYEQIIAAVNRFRGKVLALDIPSGLNADTGCVMGAAVKAEVTVTFIGLKQGLFTGEGPECCGEVMFADLDTPREVQGCEETSARLLPPPPLDLLPRRRTAHKGHFGHVLIIGGETGYTGAARLAGEAALRAGAGLVSVATRSSHAAFLNEGRPELMCRGVEAPVDLRPLLSNASIVAVGPGLGQSAWARELLAEALASGLPLVADADALNLIARNPMKRSQWVLTPHPGEAARLLGVETSAVQTDRFAAIARLQQRYGGTVILKGAGTLVLSESGTPAICRQGNPGMASGGMGDVLCGVIAGLAAQGLSLGPAAELGVVAHAAAADRAAADSGERGLLASDLMPHLRRLVNP